MKRAIDALMEDPRELPLITVVGDKSRTWYDDLDVLHAVLGILREAREFLVVHNGKLPFDLHLENVCGWMGIIDHMYGPSDSGDRMEPYQRAPELVEMVSLMIVFPREGTRPEDTDPLVHYALEEGVTVISVSRSGECGYVGVSDEEE
jgi:hypothetical protein